MCQCSTAGVSMSLAGWRRGLSFRAWRLRFGPQHSIRMLPSVSLGFSSGMQTCWLSSQTKVAVRVKAVAVCCGHERWPSLCTCGWISQLLLCMDGVQVTRSRIGSTCGPHTSNLQESQGWGPPLEWTGVHGHGRAGSRCCELWQAPSPSYFVFPSCTMTASIILCFRTLWEQGGCMAGPGKAWWSDLTSPKWVSRPTVKGTPLFLPSLVLCPLASQLPSPLLFYIRSYIQFGSALPWEAQPQCVVHHGLP